MTFHSESLKLTQRFSLFFLFSYLLFCCKTTYIHQDESGTSKFIIYSNTYKYEEDSKYGKYHAWGTYEVKDSIMFLVYSANEKIPYNYSERFVKNKRQSTDHKYIKLSVVDRLSNEPLLFSTISMIDSLGKNFYGVATDFDGTALVEKNSRIRFLKVDYVGYAHQVIDYEDCLNWDVVVKLEHLRSGKATITEGCYSYFIDVILEYKINDPTDIKQLERNGMVYEKEEKRK